MVNRWGTGVKPQRAKSVEGPCGERSRYHLTRYRREDREISFIFNNPHRAPCAAKTSGRTLDMISTLLVPVRLDHLQHVMKNIIDAEQGRFAKTQEYLRDVWTSDFVLTNGTKIRHAPQPGSKLCMIFPCEVASNEWREESYRLGYTFLSLLAHVPEDSIGYSLAESLAFDLIQGRFRTLSACAKHPFLNSHKNQQTCSLA